VPLIINVHGGPIGRVVGGVLFRLTHFVAGAGLGSVFYRTRAAVPAMALHLPPPTRMISAAPTIATS